MHYFVKSLIFDICLFGYVFGMVALMALGMDQDQMQESMASGMGAWALGTLACLVAGGLAGTLLNRMGFKTLGGYLFEPPHKKGDVLPKTWFKTFWGTQLWVTFLLTLWVGLHVTEFSFYELFSEAGFSGARRIFLSLIQPNFEILPEAILAIIETIYIAFIATVLAVPVAFVLSFFTAKNLTAVNVPGLVVYSTLRTLLNVARSLEPLVWAIIFSVWVGIGPFAGMLALMLHSVASLAKQYSEIIECIDDGPVEGIRATGANTLQTVWFAVVPQIVLPYISFTIYRWDINVRMATIIGLVGGGGIGTMLIQYQGQALWKEVGTLALLIVLVVWIMDTASAYIREAIK